MKTIPEPTLNVTEAFGLVTKYRRLIMTSTVLSMMLFVAASFAMPKRFKCHFSLTIYAKYFQNPLIRDFIPEVSDTAEMKAQRESLIRQALTPDFLDKLGEQYGIYHPKRGQAALLESVRHVAAPLKVLVLQAGFFRPAKGAYDIPVAREALLARIQVLDLNNTTFNVSFIYSDPDVTLNVTREIYAQVVRTVLEAHLNNLVNIRDAIHARLESLAFNMSSSPDPRASLRPGIVKEELDDVRNQIRALSTQFTEDHPAIKALRNRERILNGWQGEGAENTAQPSSGQDSNLLGGGSQEAMKDIYDDLTKKLNYLNIAQEADQSQQGDYLATFESPMYPEAPLWPKKGLMLLWGFTLGFVGSLSIAALKEYLERTTFRASAVAEHLGLPLLGHIPVVPWSETLPAENRL
jgi:hypothetical protein